MDPLDKPKVEDNKVEDKKVEPKKEEPKVESNLIKVDIGGEEVELTPEEHRDLLRLGVAKLQELKQPTKVIKEEPKKTAKEEPEPDPDEDEEDSVVVKRQEALEKQIQELTGEIKSLRSEKSQEKLQLQLEKLLDSDPLTKSNDKIRTRVARSVLMDYAQNTDKSLKKHFKEVVDELNETIGEERANYLRGKVKDATKTEPVPLATKVMGTEKKTFTGKDLLNGTIRRQVKEAMKI